MTIDPIQQNRINLYAKDIHDILSEAWDVDKLVPVVNDLMNTAGEEHEFTGPDMVFAGIQFIINGYYAIGSSLGRTEEEMREDFEMSVFTTSVARMIHGTIGAGVRADEAVQ